MKIYLASPFFNEKELEVYRQVILTLRGAGFEVYVPQEHEIENAWSLSNDEWAVRVFLEDVAAIKDCQMVFVLNHGIYSDSGTAWEAGFAFALNKPVYQVVVGDSNTTYSLMMMNGCNANLSIDQLMLLTPEHFNEDGYIDYVLMPPSIIQK